MAPSLEPESPTPSPRRPRRKKGSPPSETALDPLTPELRLTPELKAFLGRSHVIDEQGRPLVVWHACKTGLDLTTFDMAKALDGAHFFTGNPAHAGYFGRARPYVLRIENPLVITQDDLENRWDERVNDGGSSGVLPRDMVTSFVREARSAGHDGLIVRRMADLDLTEDVFLPFNPGDIKSADRNCGRYDRTNPDVRA